MHIGPSHLATLSLAQAREPRAQHRHAPGASIASLDGVAHVHAGSRHFASLRESCSFEHVDDGPFQMHDFCSFQTTSKKQNDVVSNYLE